MGGSAIPCSSQSGTQAPLAADAYSQCYCVGEGGGVNEAAIVIGRHQPLTLWSRVRGPALAQ